MSLVVVVGDGDCVVIRPKLNFRCFCVWVGWTIYNGDIECGVVPLFGMYSFSKSRSRSISLPAAAKSPCSDNSRSRKRLISRWHV